MVGTLASRATGLLRNSLFNQLFPQVVTDAFAVAFKVPNLFRELLAEGALTNAFVPVYRGLGRIEAKRLAGALFSLLLLVNALLVLALTLAAPWLVRLLLGSEGGVDFGLAVQLTRVVFPFLAAISLSAFAMGVLQAEERFFGPAWAPVALNLVTVVLMLTFPGRAVPLALAFVCGGVAQFLVQIPFLIRFGLFPRLGLRWHPELAAVLILAGPLAFTTGARQALNVISTRILDTLEAGSQTAFFNADLFLSLALGLFSISPALPDAFAGTLLEGLRLIAFLTAPAGLLLLLLPDAAVQSVLNWVTAFRPSAGTDPRTLALSALALAPLGLAVFPLGLSNLLVRTFYVRREVRLPLAISVGFVVVSGVLYALLASRFGIAGLSWGLTLAAWGQFGVLLALVGRREQFGLLAFGRYMLTVWLAAGLAAVVTFLLLRAVPFGVGWFGFFGQALLGVGALCVLYALLGLALRLPELERLSGRSRRRDSVHD